MRDGANAIADPIRPVPHMPIFILTSTQMSNCSMRVKHAEILRHQLLVVQDFAGAAGEDAAPGIEDHHLIGNIERELDILLDQHDGLAFFLEAPDGATDFRDDQRNKRQLCRVSHEQKIGELKNGPT